MSNLYEEMGKYQLGLKRLCIFAFLCLFRNDVKALGGQSSKLFPFGLEHLDFTLPRDIDDVSSPEIRLQVPIVLYGRQYTSIFVNQNGLVSFLTEIPVFQNIQFPLDYPIIAPFYSDVDTRISGTVYYRESTEDEVLERARTLFSDHFSSAVNFQPKSLFIVTYDNVGYFDRKSDKVFNNQLPPEKLPLPSDRSNTYQLVIGSDGGDSYVVFLYEQVQWIQGTGKTASLPDAKAQAGLNSGQGPHYELKGSGTDQVYSIHKRSNTNEEGVWMFQIGRIGEIIQEPDLNVAHESSSETSSSCAAGGQTSCHSQATCIDYNPGYCCQCTRGYFGNGKICLPNDVPFRAAGKVKGVFNGMSLDDADLFSYIIPQDGRAYTAVAQVEERIGFDMQTVVTLGSSFGWLFSIPGNNVGPKVPNGFTLTGGMMNYTSEIIFQQQNHKVQVHQTFSGLDVFSHLRVDTRIHGSAPIVPVGKTIEINNFRMDFTRVSPGLLRSRSSHSYVIEGTSLEHPFTVEQTINYEECPFSSGFPTGMETLTSKIGRHYIVYDASQNITRYAITSTTWPVDGDDPCLNNKNKCLPNSSCLVDGENFRCVCNLGYEEQYNYHEDREYGETSNSQIPQCIDQDECQIGTSTCDATAICYNSPGSFHCRCQPGYAGDGYSCKKILSCSDIQCGPNAQCLQISIGNPECRCVSGYEGDGIYCYERSSGHTDDNEPMDCRKIRNLCGPFAECIYSGSSQSHVCSCKAGYEGDGSTCHRTEMEDEVPCDVVNNCDINASCRPDEDNEYSCVCKSGYNGDGYTCEAQEQAPSPICTSPFQNDCTCPTGFNYDADRDECIRSSGEVLNCYQVPNICDPNASCLYQNNVYECICNEGFQGDGTKCLGSVQNSCSNHSDCGSDGECTYNSGNGGFTCGCRQGFFGDGYDCRPAPNAGCDILRNCHSNATCSWNSRTTKFSCECKPGYRGNGQTCQEDVLGCQELQNCGKNAECSYDGSARGYRCRCSSGYAGDGYKCRSTISCYQDNAVCDPNAVCTPDSANRAYECQCRSGFYGDGQDCKEISKTKDGHSLIVAKGMSLIKIELTDNKILPLTVEPFQTAIGIDLDCNNQKLYWSDVATRAIKTSNVNGTAKSTFLGDEIDSPEGLSVDWANGNIYWTDSKKDTIEVIINTDLVNPRGIATYSQRGRLFWSDWNRDFPKIEYSGLDGQDRQVLVGDNLALPNSLVIDHENDRLCWGDAGTHKIECVGIDGRNRRTHVAQAQYPFGVAMSSENFYWSDWESKKIESASRRTGEKSTSYEVALGGPGKLYGLIYVPTECAPVYSTCEYSPCGNRICLPNTRGGRSCLCSDEAPEDCQDLI